MKKEILKSLIDMIDENDTETIFRVLIRFVPEDTPLPDEIVAIARATLLSTPSFFIKSFKEAIVPFVCGIRPPEAKLKLVIAFSAIFS